MDLILIEAVCSWTSEESFAKLLDEHPTILNATDVKENYTALIWAVKGNRVKIVEIICQKVKQIRGEREHLDYKAGWVSKYIFL